MQRRGFVTSAAVGAAATGHRHRGAHVVDRIDHHRALAHFGQRFVGNAPGCGLLTVEGFTKTAYIVSTSGVTF